MTPEQLSACGLSLSTTQYLRLEHFVRLLLRENQWVNLTAIREPQAVWRLHICESLALLPLIERSRAQTLLDLGTGGGLPGIPLACVRDDLAITLLDATRKKLIACERMVTELGLRHVGWVWGRAEELAHDQRLRQRFDAVTARGVGPLPTLIEYAAGFVRVGGQCWFSKSLAGIEAEVERAKRAAGQCGLRLADLHRFSLPEEPGQRVVVVYQKHKSTPKRFPREPGRPKRRPL